jgi:hypothetical protein
MTKGAAMAANTAEELALGRIRGCDFLAAIERRRNLAQPPRKGGEVSGQLCELPHIGAPKNMGALFRQAQRGDAEEMQMRLGIGIAFLVVTIGLIWSVAAMSQWVPVVSAGYTLAPKSTSGLP